MKTIGFDNYKYTKQMNIEDRRLLSNQGISAADMDRWKHIIEKKINCDKNDINCWKSLLPQLPCDLADTSCWKNSYPGFPISKPPCNLYDGVYSQQKPKKCFYSVQEPKESVGDSWSGRSSCNANDEQCWKQLLPQLPCKLHDEECWRNYHISRMTQFSPRQRLTVQNVSTAMVNDTQSIWLV